YAYLQTILLGLRGMEVGSRAEEILKALQRLKNDFEKFSSDLEVLGRHINNTRAKYDEVEKKVEGFRYALDGLSTGEGGPAGEKPELT
ncbi:MAG TPA: DNA recombination protein RmuC, partial [Thermodesulfobacteriota bacterium]|nr:DNA recombination protein RmuC [Thermodesulfobacteriota bacterium]